MKHPGAILVAALAMSGCAGSEPVAIAPPIAAPAVYATDLPAAGLQEEWWLGFGDPVLDRLIRRGLEANLDIDAASGRLAAAAAKLVHRVHHVRVHSVDRPHCVFIVLIVLIMNRR